MDGLRIGPWLEGDAVTLDKVLDEADALTGQFRPQQGPPTADPFRAKVFAGGPAAGFAAAHGFRVIQRSRTVQLDRALPPNPEMSVEIDAAPDAVAAAFLDIYVRTHAWDPPGDVGVDDVLAVHVGDAAGVVLAAAGLYDEEAGLELSGGATTGAGTLARPAVGALLDTASAHAATRRRPLLVEVDDSNTELVTETTARQAVPVDEAHIVVDDPAAPAGVVSRHGPVT